MTYNYNDEIKGVASLFENGYKKTDKQPDLTGTIVIPYELLEEASSDPYCQMELKGQQCLKLKIAMWEVKNDSRSQPVLKGSITKVNPPKNSEDTPPPTSNAFEAKGRKKLS